MDKYVFTQAGFDDFKRIMADAEKNLHRATKEKGDAGNGQDAWHDEGHKMGLADEMMWSQRFGELQRILHNAQIIVPEEQDRKVKIGNGVLLDYDDGFQKYFIIDGYLSSTSVGKVSVYSPLGKALINKEEGVEGQLKIGETTQVFTVVKIFLPSQADIEKEKFYRENADGK